MTRIAGLCPSLHSPPAPDAGALLAGFDAPIGVTTTRQSGRCSLGAVSLPGTSPVATRGQLTAVVDGHIYNAADLGAAGSSAAAILVGLVESVGIEEALRRVNGDFAAAVHDAGTNRLWLARDRFGVKPLYYASVAGLFAFASQPSPLVRLPGVSRDVNRAFVARFAGLHYRTFDNAPMESPFAAVAQVAAGHIAEVGPAGDVHQRPYWSLVEREDLQGSDAALAEQYRDLLVDAVRQRLKVARAPAFTLSGGMDSSSVLASAVRVTGEKQHAFSSVYQDRTYDESDEIRSMLDTSVAEWHAVRIDAPDVFSLVPRMIRAHDEPVATATWLSHYVLCEQVAAQGFGALFGGLGGDELNAGEYEYFFFHFADLRRAGEEQTLAAEVAAWAVHHDHPIYRKNADVADSAIRRLTDLSTPGRCLVDGGRLEKYRASVSRDYYDLGPFVPVMDHPFRSYLRNRTYQDIYRETAPCCLRAEDRQSSVFGLDHFDPFFDHRLVEFMFRVPGRLKIRDGVTKVLLRQATKGLLPEETRTRIKKTGWNAPAHVWFSGRGLDDVRDLVASRRFRERGIYVTAEVERIIKEHEDILQSPVPRENHMMFLWQLVNLEFWLQYVESV